MVNIKLTQICKSRSNHTTIRSYIGQLAGRQTCNTCLGQIKAVSYPAKIFLIVFKKISVTLVKWLGTLFSQLDSLKPFPSLHRKVTLGSVWCLEKQALHNRIPIKVILDVIWRQSAPHLEGLGRHHVLLVHGSVMAWREEATSAVTREKIKEGRNTHTEHFLCVPGTQHICSHLPTQKPLQGGSYDRS